MKRLDFSWATEGIKAIDKYNTLETEKGQELYNKAWLNHDMAPQSKEGWEQLFKEIDDFIDNPNNPQEDKDKIIGILEAAAMHASIWK